MFSRTRYSFKLRSEQEQVVELQLELVYRHELVPDTADRLDVARAQVDRPDTAAELEHQLVSERLRALRDDKRLVVVASRRLGMVGTG